MMHNDSFEAIHLKNASQKLSIILKNKMNKTREPAREKKVGSGGILNAFLNWFKR